MAHKYQVLFNTCPDRAAAEKIADLLVTQSLAACVTILPGARSVYSWQGRLEHSDEYVLMIKARTDAYEKLEQAILDAHPYELPELIAVPITAGLAAYLDWMGNPS